MTMTTRKQHSPEQVVRKLAQADRMLGYGPGCGSTPKRIRGAGSAPPTTTPAARAGG
jgi:hypothetical protein